MYKKVLAIFIFTIISSSVYAADDFKKPIWLMVRAGLMSPNGSYSNFDSSFMVGGVIGVQLSRFFALEAGVDYSEWSNTTSIANLKSLSSFSTFDIKAYLLFQPVITVSSLFSILPNVGIGVIYSITDPVDKVGYGVKAGIRFHYRMFLIGAYAEYVSRGYSNMNYAGEVGIAF